MDYNLSCHKVKANRGFRTVLWSKYHFSYRGWMYFCFLSLAKYQISLFQVLEGTVLLQILYVVLWITPTREQLSGLTRMVASVLLMFWANMVFNWEAIATSCVFLKVDWFQKWVFFFFFLPLISRLQWENAALYLFACISNNNNVDLVLWQGNSNFPELYLKKKKKTTMKVAPKST